MNLLSKVLCCVMSFAFLAATVEVEANGPIRQFFQNWRQARMERLQYVNSRYSARYSNSYGSSGASNYGSQGGFNSGYGSQGGYSQRVYVQSYGSSGYTRYNNRPATVIYQDVEGNEIPVEGVIKTGPVRRVLGVPPRFVPKCDGPNCDLGATDNPACDCEDCKCVDCQCGQTELAGRLAPGMNETLLAGTLAPGMQSNPLLASL